ncbi:uncharacterized protein [Chelonus insularis]|uniref:uncharacterized protein n=1 Tax=Chelonus insularis TaxID=460826 RepID=UPI00158E60B8|nr:uncharacterized protein LOC118067781 [Chelonus insularis]
MKLSIAIVVLATIIYGCQCAPYPDWSENFNQQMQDLENRLHQNEERRNQQLEAGRLEREEKMRQLHERLEAGRLEIEENMRKMDERLEAGRLEIEENMRKMDERREAERLEREENMRKMNEQLETASQNAGSGSIFPLNNYFVNGVHVYHRVNDKTIDNIRERTVIDYTSKTGKTEIKKYKCEIPINSPCVLKSTEVKDGPPTNVYYSQNDFMLN